MVYFPVLFNHCSITFFAATCNPTCVNGGVCRSPRSCDCTNAIGYTGNDCSIRKFLFSLTKSFIFKRFESHTFFHSLICKIQCSIKGFERCEGCLLLTAYEKKTKLRSRFLHQCNPCHHTN